MVDTLAARAATVVELMRRSSELGMAPRVDEDGSLWLYGSYDVLGRKVGNSIAKAIHYLERVETRRQSTCGQARALISDTNPSRRLN